MAWTWAEPEGEISEQNCLDGWGEKCRPVERREKEGGNARILVHWTTLTRPQKLYEQEKIFSWL